jgi:hypothetical protein
MGIRNTIRTLWRWICTFHFRRWEFYVWTLLTYVCREGVQCISSATPTDSLSPPAHTSPSNVRQLVTHSPILIILATSWDEQHSHWPPPFSMVCTRTQLCTVWAWYLSTGRISGKRDRMYDVHKPQGLSIYLKLKRVRGDDGQVCKGN